MGTTLGAIGLLGFFACILWMLIRLIRRKPLKPAGIGMLVCVVLFFGGVGIMMATGEVDTKKDDTSMKQNVEETKNPSGKSGSEESGPNKQLDVESVEMSITSEIPSEYQSSEWFYIQCDTVAEGSAFIDLQIDQGTDNNDAALNLASQCFEIAKSKVEDAGAELESFSITVVNGGSPVGLFSTSDGKNFTKISGGKRTEITLS